MEAPSLELQGAVVAALKADAGVDAICGDRIYDDVRVLEQAVFPYVSLGPMQEIQDDADCIEAVEITLQIDCWSRSVGKPQVKRLAFAVRRALKAANLSLSENALVTFEHTGSRYLTDPDGQTHHAALTFETVIEQP